MEDKSFNCLGDHEVYCCGARVLIKDGKVTVLSEPRVMYCPLHGALYGTEEIDKESVKRSVEAKIKNLGFCCEQRIFDNSLVVPYGTSEIVCTCMKMGMLDCAVTVCEGAGTVISITPDLVQEMGARLTGIVRTSPIRSIIEHIKDNGGFILDESSARIDQAEGVAKAAELGYRRIAVTVTSFKSDSIEGIREVEKDKGIEATVFSVCNTCAGEADVDRILAGADVVCASASRLIREKIGAKSNMQLGVAIPLFTLTKLGKKLLLAYLTEFSDSIVTFRTGKMPYIVEGRGPRLRE
ncbi:MAG: DUF2099 family protein [Candidatus Bathyarchaeota archaeon]|nr:DUF2099 family protein [Candidatus Bathyarchaeota archaeon]